MSLVFADTSYYIALANPNDVWHQRAVEFSRHRRLRALTTEFVLVELYGATQVSIVPQHQEIDHP